MASAGLLRRCLRNKEDKQMGLFTDGFKELKKASEPLYKSPKSIQETIEIMAVAENGIFEVARNRYSKCYLFQDINYTTTNEDEQIDILPLPLSVRILKRQRHSLQLWKPPFTRHLMSLEQRLFLLPVIRDLRFSMIFTI